MNGSVTVLCKKHGLECRLKDGKPWHVSWGDHGFCDDTKFIKRRENVMTRAGAIHDLVLLERASGNFAAGDMSRQEWIEARHWLQQLSEQAKSVRNAMDPVHGVLAVSDEVWRAEWRGLKKALDEFTDRVMRDESPVGGVGDRNA